MLFFEPVPSGTPCEYPVSKASTLNLKSLETGAEMKVKGGHSWSFLLLFAQHHTDTKRKRQENWTMAPSKQKYRAIMK